MSWRASTVFGSAALGLMLGGAACSLAVSLDGLAGGSATDADLDAAGPDGALGSDTAPPADGGSRADADDADAIATNPYRAAVLADKPIAYWRFEETSGTVAADELGARDGTYHQAPNLGVPGVIPGTRALGFPSGGIARVEVFGDVFRFPGTAPNTIEVWVNPGEFKGFQWLAGTENLYSSSYNTFGGWSLHAGSDATLTNKVNLEYSQTPVRSTVTNPNALTAGVWQHVVTTYDGAVMSTYVNSVLVAQRTAASGAAQNVGSLMIGCVRYDNASGVTFCLSGWSLDEFAVYDVALSAAKVKAHFALGKP